MDEFYITEEDKKYPIQQRYYRRVFLIYNPKDIETRDVLTDTAFRLYESGLHAETDAQEFANEVAQTNKELRDRIAMQDSTIAILQEQVEWLMKQQSLTKGIK